jgi:hypothetical protein
MDTKEVFIMLILWKIEACEQLNFIW